MSFPPASPHPWMNPPDDEPRFVTEYCPTCDRMVEPHETCPACGDSGAGPAAVAQAITVPEYIDMCARCGYQAWREGYPCNRCGGLEAIRFVPRQEQS